MPDSLKFPSLANIAKFLGSNSLTDEDLVRLSEANAVSIRTAIAANSRTTAQVLSKLACDPSQAVRMAVATNAATPDQFVKKLESDSEPQHLHCVPELDLPPEILIALMQHKNPYIRTQAKITWEGRKFEQLLVELGLKPIAGEEHRLGELLIEARFIRPIVLEDTLVGCQLYKIPLGRALLQTNSIAAPALSMALRIQSMIRSGSMPRREGIKELILWNNRQA